jgi:hypothetical protein
MPGVIRADVVRGPYDLVICAAGADQIKAPPHPVPLDTRQ